MCFQPVTRKECHQLLQNVGEFQMWCLDEPLTTDTLKLFYWISQSNRMVAVRSAGIHSEVARRVAVRIYRVGTWNIFWSSFFSVAGSAGIFMIRSSLRILLWTAWNTNLFICEIPLARYYSFKKKGHWLIHFVHTYEHTSFHQSKCTNSNTSDPPRLLTGAN